MLGLVIGLVLGYCIGWVNAHHTVATECRKLGSFFVGKSVFKCIEIEDKKDEH